NGLNRSCGQSLKEGESMGSNRGVKHRLGRRARGACGVGSRAVVHLVVAAALGMICLHSAAFGQCTLTGTVSTWNDGNSDWNTTSNWKPTGVPNSSSTSVCITNGTSSVALDINATVDNLQLAKGNSLNFNDNTHLTVDGSSILNAGNLTLNSLGNAT